MDKYSIFRYNKANKSFGVMDMSTVQIAPTKVKDENSTNQKPQSISELRKMLAIKTAPGHSLLSLYKRGQQ
ncbi:hypothetical protein [Bacillus sp. J33]|uniref:hypothetical protein n=1 Tax=Bacillus sp. J33 TaxID=935836 RepID=UPI00047D208B|nr:hypothetical protein [Bacillus sp. J33]